MEQIAVLLFLIGFPLFIGFGFAVGNNYNEEEEFLILDRLKKTEMNFYISLTVLGGISLLGSLMLSIIHLIKNL